MKVKRYSAITTVLIVAIGLSLLLLALTRVSASVFVPLWAAADPPTVTAVRPNHAPNDLDISVVISGTGFMAALSGTLVMTSPLTYLGDTALDDVTWINTTTLSATVPWGMEPGVYTLTVVNADRETGSLPDAFTVTQGIGVWTTNGPYGGHVGYLVLNPVTPTQILASVMWSGLFASYDAAGEWQPVLINGFPERVAFDAVDPQIMYIGAGGSLLRSDDGGLKWQDLQRQRRCADAVRPIAHPTLSGVVYLAVFCHRGEEAQGGLYKSTDWGLNWITMTTGLSDTNVTSFVFHPDDPNLMYLGALSGEVYTSTNGGETWTFAAHLPNRVDGLYVNSFGDHEVWAESNGYFVGGNTPPPNLFKSLNPDLTAWETITVTHAPVWSLAFHPTISGTLYAAAEDGYVSVDGGKTWDLIGVDLPWHAKVEAREFVVDSADPSVMYAATGNGVYKSLDGGVSWFDATHKLAGILPTELAVSPLSPREVYANTNIFMVMKTSNAGQSWKALSWPRVHAIEADPFVRDRVYASASWCNYCIVISEDGGATYREITYTLPTTYTGWWAYTALIAADPLIPGHLLMASNLGPTGGVEDGGLLLYNSDDYGESWQFTSFHSPRWIQTIVYDPINPGVVYVDSVGLYKSTDGGWNWQLLTAGRPELDAIEAIAVHPRNPAIIFIGVSSPGGSGFLQGIYRSLDGGATWEFLPGEQSGGPPRALAFAMTDPPTLYFGGVDSGLWRSTDNGESWQVAAGMSQGTVWSLASSTIDDGRVIVYVGISGGAIGSSDFTTASTGNDLTLLGSGVYRLTTLLPTERVYLPLVVRQSGAMHLGDASRLTKERVR